MGWPCGAGRRRRRPCRGAGAEAGREREAAGVLQGSPGEQGEGEADGDAGQDLEYQAAAMNMRARGGQAGHADGAGDVVPEK